MSSRALIRIFADVIFVSHVLVVFVILFGWYFSTLSDVYIALLAMTFISELLFGHCVLTKWEFDLRKKLEPGLNYNYSFISYYGYKLLGLNPKEKYLRYPALAFLVISIIIFYART